MSERITEHKLASELTYRDIGKRIKGMHGAKGLISGKPAPTLNRIKSIILKPSGIAVVVYRNRFETTETFYSLDETVKLTYFA